MMATENRLLPPLQRAISHHHTASPYWAVTFGNVSVISVAPCIIQKIDLISVNKVVSAMRSSTAN